MGHVSHERGDKYDYIPEPHRKVFAAIDGEVMWVHVVWKTFRELFASQQNVKLLNSTAPAGARVIQDALLDDVVLSLSRLTDPPTTGRFQNLVLQSLTELAKQTGDEKVVDQFESAFSEIASRVEVLRKHRDKRIAHSDLDVAAQDEKLPGYSRQSIEDALSSVRKLLNGFHMHFRQGTTAYEMPILSGGGDLLISYLKLGRRFQKIRDDSYQLDDQQLREQVQRWDWPENEVLDEEPFRPLRRALRAVLNSMRTRERSTSLKRGPGTGDGTRYSSSAS
jgi:hypothetical protein